MLLLCFKGLALAVHCTNTASSYASAKGYAVKVCGYVRNYCKFRIQLFQLVGVLSDLSVDASGFGEKALVLT